MILVLAYILISWFIYTIGLYKIRNVRGRDRQPELEKVTTATFAWPLILPLAVCILIPLYLTALGLGILNDLSEKTVRLLKRFD